VLPTNTGKNVPDVLVSTIFMLSIPVKSDPSPINAVPETVPEEVMFPVETIVPEVVNAVPETVPEEVMFPVETIVPEAVMFPVEFNKFPSTVPEAVKEALETVPEAVKFAMFKVEVDGV